MTNAASAAIQQIPQPGICPVPAQQPTSVPVPTGPDSDGNTMGVPVPRPIMPPLMCVLPQVDGSPMLLPMLPAMYMATFGKNTPDFMGRVPIQHHHLPGTLMGMPHTQHQMSMNPMLAQPAAALTFGRNNSHGQLVPPMQGPILAGAPHPLFHGYTGHDPAHMSVPFDNGQGQVTGIPSWGGGAQGWLPRRPTGSQSTLPPLVAEAPPDRPAGRSTRVGTIGRSDSMPTRPTAKVHGPPRRSASVYKSTNKAAGWPTQPGLAEVREERARARAVNSSTLRIADMKLESDVSADGDGDLSLELDHGGELAMDMDFKGGADEAQAGELAAGETADPDAEMMEGLDIKEEEPGMGDEAATAIADAMGGSPQKRRTRNSIAANF
jgi:hypothetical protein